MTYTQQELIDAFETVQNKKNWKYSIDARISVDQMDIVGEAIAHFTGSIPHFDDGHDGTIRVEAEGYYIAIGA